MKFDFLIVGAGLSGLVLAERLCTQLNKTCLIVDERNHIGGNCYDKLDEHGVLIHPYGPHWFRTNSNIVINYLSQFTDWIPANYEIKSLDNGKLWSFPINLNTFEEMIERKSSPKEFSNWINNHKENIPNPQNSEEAIISQIGTELYEKFYLGYTQKQWGVHPKELDASVCKRIPIRTYRDNRYVNEFFQQMPSEGYTTMFQNMIKHCGNNLKIELEKKYRRIEETKANKIIYTGRIDSFFNYKYGILPYRSLQFQFRHYHKKYKQPYVSIHYPNEREYTRSVEIKHVTKQKTPNTTIAFEYPCDCVEGREPFYPIPTSANKDIYHKYKTLSDSLHNVYFIGRMATYKYINMDQTIMRALRLFENIKRGKS